MNFQGRKIWNHAFCVDLNPGCKKMRFQLALNETFIPNPQPFTQRQVKQCQRTNINKTMLSATISLIIYKHYTHTHTHTHTHTKLRDVARGRSEGEFSNPWSSKRKSWTYLPSSFHLIKTRKRKIKL